jgi:hypothetical protein
MTKRITIFGGSIPRPGEPAYSNAQDLGRRVADLGWSVLTGGYVGIMEAVSRGANEAGGHVIGVTCREIENYRKGRANPWVTEEIKFDSLRDRMYHLVDDCDAAIALPGGIGTLSEIGAMWSTIQTSGSAIRPLVLIGEGWAQTVQTMFSSLGTYVRPDDQSLVSFAQDGQSALQQLQGFFEAS